MFISQDKIFVEIFENQDGKWVSNEFKGADAVATIARLEIPRSIFYQFSNKPFETNRF